MECLIVVSIDQSYLDRNVGQLLCDSETAEAGANNHDVWIVAHFFLPSIFEQRLHNLSAQQRDFSGGRYHQIFDSYFLFVRQRTQPASPAREFCARNVARVTRWKFAWDIVSHVQDLRTPPNRRNAEADSWQPAAVHATLLSSSLQ